MKHLKILAAMALLQAVLLFSTHVFSAPTVHEEENKRFITAICEDEYFTTKADKAFLGTITPLAESFYIYELSALDLLSKQSYEGVVHSSTKKDCCLFPCFRKKLTANVCYSDVGYRLDPCFEVRVLRALDVEDCAAEVCFSQRNQDKVHKISCRFTRTASGLQKIIAYETHIFQN